MTYPIKSPRKLIEVALPLDAINAACAYEKMPGIGAHPRGIHLWWARRPLAAARAVIFAQLVNDPGYQQDSGFKYGMNKKDAAAERKRLFAIIEDLVKWENSTNETVLEQARVEIRRSWQEVCALNRNHPHAAELFNTDRMPAFHDPFAGGGAIPLEAQRLGLEAHASDLNPVAVLINKGMIEIPPKFSGRSPVGPTQVEKRSERLNISQDWPGATGLAEDVRRYGSWMHSEASKRIGHLYPAAEVTPEMVGERPDLCPLLGKKLPVIAWIWTRTVRSSNPAFSHVQVPLASTFILANKEGKEAYVAPVVEGDNYRFAVKMGFPPQEAKSGTKLARGANFSCLISGAPIEPKHIYSEAQANRDFDAETQFCLHWFGQYKWTEGPFGDADTLSRGKGSNVDRMKEAGILQSGGSKVRLLKWLEYPANWAPRTGRHTPIWEALHQLIRALKQEGESVAGSLLAALGGKAEAVRQLAYRLYTLCERLGQAEDARAYNELITSWTGIEAVANSAPQPVDLQRSLFES